MDAIILGSSPGLPQVDRHLSSILVRKDKILILADCGEGCAHHLLKQGIGPDELDAVLITHYHPDHVSGLFMLIQMLYLMGRTKTLPVFLPERPAVIMEILHTMYTFSQKFAFRLQLLEMQQAELFYDWIEPVSTDHLYGYASLIREHSLPNTMKSWALRFTDDNGALVYTSDLGTTDCISELLKGANTAIVDAGHPEADQILKLKYLEIKRIVLTHGISAELDSRMHELDMDVFEFAKENHVYQV